MRNNRMLKIYCAWLLAIVLCTSMIASVGTSYARYSYTGENQTVVHSAGRTPVTSEIMLDGGCTVVLYDWNVEEEDYMPQVIQTSLRGKDNLGMLTVSVPEEYKGYFTVSLTYTDDTPITPEDIIWIGEKTEFKITVEPVVNMLVTLAEDITPEVTVAFTELLDNTARESTELYREGDTITGTLKWNITAKETPVPVKPPLPTATATELTEEKLTFALNFKADPVTQEQLDYYGGWYADFEIKLNKDITFNDDKSADGWLAGQLDAWSERWITIPPYENLTVQANTPLRIMEYAGKLIGQGGHRYTYGEIYEGIKDFDCGIYLDEEFLAANPDVEVTLELRMYNPADESESYVLGETHVFKLTDVKLPTATATELAEEKLTFALNFKADVASALQLYMYGDWYADFEIKLNKDITFNDDKSADGWLAGQLDAWSERWITIPPYENLTVQANTPLRIMEYAGKLIGQGGHRYTYREIYEGIKDFDCGIYLDEEFIKANPDVEITLELRMYNPADESESYVLGETYIFNLTDVAKPTARITEIVNENLSYALNFKADTATELQKAVYGDWYADFEIKLNKDITFNDDKSADGWLAGQLDAWSPRWITIPPYENLTVQANTPLRIMEYAGKLIGQGGHRYTYREIYEGIKDFDCGIYLDEEFLAANPDVEITLELRMYNPADESESYVLGRTQVFRPAETAKPTATVTEIENENLSVALNFKADTASAVQQAMYGDWYADFELKLNKDITFNDDKSADGWLAGQLDAWSERWITIPPYENLTVQANTPLRIMEYAGKLIGQGGHRYTYGEIYEGIKDFDCGIYLDEEFLAANPDVEITLELRMYNPADESESYVLGQTYTFTAADLAPQPQAEQPVMLNLALKPMNLTVADTEAEAPAQETPAQETEGGTGDEVVETPPAETPEENPQPDANLSAGSVISANLTVLSADYVTTYMQVSYPRGTSALTITQGERLTPFTQVHTDKGVFVYPFGGKFTEEVNPEEAGTKSYMVANCVADRETPPSYALTTLTWIYADQTTKTSEQNSYCYKLTGTDFATTAPKTDVLNAISTVKFSTIFSQHTEATIKSGCVIEIFDGTEYVPANKDHFSIKLGNDKKYFELSAADGVYPQAGVYRVGYILQPGNMLSVKYKTFFVNYR